jgi:tetratricopeptide (TPR) repeat protein
MVYGSTRLANFLARIPCIACTVVCLWLLTTASAQTVDLRNNPGALLELPSYYSSEAGTGVLVFTVFAEHSPTHLDRQALLKLVDATKHTESWQATEDTSKGVFTNVPYGTYQLEVSAVGYISAQKEIKVAQNFGPVQIDIALHRDPAAINLDAGDTALSAKARKQTKHAVSALKSANFKEAQKQLDEAYKSAPGSPELNFLLGYLYFQKKDFTQAGTYLTTATTLAPRNTQSLMLLGRTGMERQDYPAARSALEQAILADPENWLPHDLLADTYLHQKDYDKARDEAQLALAKGNASASPAQLVLGEALLGLGHDQEGIQALNVFLQQSPQQPMAGQVRNLIAQIQTGAQTSAAQPGGAQTAAAQPGAKGEAAGGPSETAAAAGEHAANSADTNLEARLSGIDATRALPTPGLSMKMWQPAGVDDVKPVLVTGVTCPSERVIEESGKRVQELASSVARIAAVEDLFHQPLDDFGNPVRTETRKYNYVASISEPEPGFLAVDEYRAEKLTLEGFPDHIASSGFAALALVFHPHMRDNFDMVCEGQGDWRGQASWLVHFRQRDDRPNRMHSYKVGNQIYPVKLKGRAWITADKFQIVRIEAEMVSAIPEIRLLSEHQIVEYGPIPFSNKNMSLWLPKNAEIYFDFRKHKYYRKHSFDHYMLFSVDSTEKHKPPIATPPAKPAGAAQATDN